MSVREGYKQTEVGVIPEEWECKTLEDIFTITAGKSKSKHIIDDGKYILVDMGAIDRNAKIVNKKFVNIEEDFLDKNDLVMPKDDIGGGQIIGKVVYIPENEKYVLGDHVFRLTLKDDNCSRYFYYLINSSYVNRIFRKKATGTAQLGLNKKSVSEQSLSVPPLPEQQKIAAILTSVDNKIEVIDEQIAKTETLKKGLMQKLLNEGIGHSEFKDSEIGRIPKEWKVVKITEIIELMTDYVANGSFASLRENVVVYDQPNYAMYVRLADIRKGLGHSEQKYVDKKSYDFLKKSSLAGDEILIANIGANVGESFLMPHLNHPATLAPNMIEIKLKKEKMLPYFCLLYLKSNRGLRELDMVIEGSGQPKVNKTKLKTIRLPLPPLPEQKQIAKIISTTDDKLDTLQAKKERCERLKRGLMQKLLTGEARVKV